MLKRIARGSVLLALAIMLGACAAYRDRGPGYADFDEAKSDLVFYGPGLDGGNRKFLTDSNARFDRIIFATYGPRHGGFPQAQIQLFELPRGGNVSTAPALSKYIAEGELSRGRKITPGKEGQTSNAAGRIRYLTFMASDNPCIAFLQFMGMRTAGGLGDKQLIGYYCKRQGRPLTSRESKEILRAIGHREHGAPKPPPEWGEE